MDQEAICNLPHSQRGAPWCLEMLRAPVAGYSCNGLCVCFAYGIQKLCTLTHGWHKILWVPRINLQFWTGINTRQGSTVPRITNFPNLEQSISLYDAEALKF